ncbi:hypothetical protein [Paracidovorax avenae]|uniref:hypothetical protein n=1 Tax=Paracidovorax avenae TaxID=80867 RepID=UPI001AD8360E|nr:hypothetical protein [Paracidovorax avenae]
MRGMPFVIDHSTNIASGIYDSLSRLERIAGSETYHLKNNLRTPLGIYNISISRIFNKTTKLARILEGLFNQENLEKSLPETKTSDAIDYIELAIYAAAEHIDDIDSIATNFFSSMIECRKNPAYRELQSRLKEKKKFISAVANSIKHQQSRIRLVSTEFFHGHNEMILYGFFIESINNGEIVPSPLFHKDTGIISATNLPWEIITFTLECSLALCDFLSKITEESSTPTRSESTSITRAAMAAARLPLYSFGEGHAFEHTKIVFNIPSHCKSEFDSGIYGSFFRGWLHFPPIEIGRSTASFEADGTNTMRFTLPKLGTIKLHRWQSLENYKNN